MGHYFQSKAIPRLFMKGQPMVFGQGDVILGNQDTPNGVYFINSGFVKVYTISNDGDEYIHLVYGQGELFPLVWAYLGIGESTRYYEAISDVLVWRLSRDIFTDRIGSNLALASATSVQLANQVKIFTDRVDNLEYKKADERIAYRLLFLASRFGTRQGNAIVIEAPITHDLFAHSVNLVRESVSREIEKLTRQRIIEQVDHKIVIIDVLALENKISNPIDFNF